MFKWLKDGRFIWYAAPFGIFLFFFGIFIFSQLAYPQFSSFDDPPYHLTHSISYLSGTMWQNPVFSTMSTRPVDLYYLYHLSLGYFIDFFGFNTENYLSLIVATKIYHSILSALFFTAFFLIARNVLVFEGAELNKRTILLSSLLAVLFLFFIVPSFTFRLFMYRPHIIAMILVLASAYFSYRRSLLGVGIVSFFMPFFYSLALFVLIPPFIHGVASVLYQDNLRKSDLLKLPQYYGIKKFKLFLFASVALIAGIIARPDSLNYVFNGFYVQLMAIYNNFFRGIDNVSEFVAPVTDAYMLAFVFIAVCFFYYTKIREVGLRQALKFERFYLFAVSQVFFILLILIYRALEYAVPAVGLFLAAVFTGSILPALKRLYAGEFDYVFSSAVLKELASMGKHFLNVISRHKKILILAFWLMIGFNFISVIAGFAASLRQEPPADLYKKASEFMRDHSQKGDIVFQQRFDMYPRLIFFNQKNRYIAGMAETFTYAYDPAIFWIWRHIVNAEPVCPQKECDEAGSPDVYETIKNTFKAKYVFIDSQQSIGGISVLNTPKFIKLLENDSRFKKVFTDAEYPDIMVFEL